MTTDSRDPEKFEEILRLYNEAESFIKEVELCVSEIAFPAINELRYSGHHLLKALVSAGPEQFNKELSDAVDHCHSSMYESSEAGIGYLLDLLKAFDTDYRDVQDQLLRHELHVAGAIDFVCAPDGLLLARHSRAPWKRAECNNGSVRQRGPDRFGWPRRA